MSDPTGADVELPRGIALAWGVAANPQRGPKREMSVERIVDAAVDIADAEGLAAVSMGAVAARLGFTPMSLYRYVSAKDDLVLLMQEAAIGAPPPIEGDDWRARVLAYHAALLQAYLAHPWVIDLPITTSMATPVTAAWMDAGIAVFDGTPVDDAARLSLTLLLTGYARWCASVAVGTARRAEASGASAGSAELADDALLSRLVTADEYPSLHRAIAAGALADGADPFAFGLARIADGVEVHLRALAAGGVTAPPSAAPAEPAAVLNDKRYRESLKRVREAEKALRETRRAARQALREARERTAHH